MRLVLFSTLLANVLLSVYCITLYYWIFVPLWTLMWLYFPPLMTGDCPVMTLLLPGFPEWVRGKSWPINLSSYVLSSVEEYFVQRPELPFYFQLIINRFLSWQVKLFYTRVQTATIKLEQQPQRAFSDRDLSVVCKNLTRTPRVLSDGDCTAAEMFASSQLLLLILARLNLM